VESVGFIGLDSVIVMVIGSRLRAPGFRRIHRLSGHGPAACSLKTEA